MNPHRFNGPFSRSLAALHPQGNGFHYLALAVAALLLTAWVAWFLAATVTVYAVSNRARLEVERAVFPVATPLEGRVVSTTLLVGRTVHAGDTLVELDTRQQSLLLREERARLAGLGPQLERLRAEVNEQEVGRRDDGAASTASKAEAQARYEEARAAADLAADHEQRLTKLAAQGLIGQADLTRAQYEAKQRGAAAETLHRAAIRLQAEHQRTDTDHRIEIERLGRQAAELQAALGTGAAAVERLQHQSDLRRITAPVSGVLAEVSTVGVGGVLKAGDTVATVVPAGRLRIVADFLPGDAFGRIVVGQAALLRLEGFPFVQYGSVAATVSSVAGEVRDGRVRVELKISAAPVPIPLQHGLPGSVEIEVERLSPAALVLRAAGRRMRATLDARGQAAATQP